MGAWKNQEILRMDAPHEVIYETIPCNHKAEIRELRETLRMLVHLIQSDFPVIAENCQQVLDRHKEVKNESPF